MILYHGTNTEIREIDLATCRPYKDFGRGFYLTPIKEQANRMASRVERIYGGCATVFSFAFDESRMSDLNVRKFDLPNETWARFVINNRNKYFTSSKGEDSNHDNKYDLVIGPVANDDLALLFKQFSAGFMTSEMLAREMTFKKLTVQYSFHTDRAVACLKKIGAVNV